MGVECERCRNFSLHKGDDGFRGDVLYMENWLTELIWPSRRVRVAVMSGYAYMDSLMLVPYNPANEHSAITELSYTCKSVDIAITKLLYGE